MVSGKQQSIAIVIYSLRRDGAEKVVSLLSQQFSQMGQKVTLIVFDGKENGYRFSGELVDLQLPSQPGASLLRKAYTLIRRSWHLRRIYRQQHFDRVIAVMESSAFASILTGYPTTVSNHCNPEVQFTAFEWFLARVLYPRATKVVMVSKQGQACLQRRLGLKNLSCIYNPVDFNALDRLAVAEPEIVVEGKYIIAVARLEAVKRLDRMLAAFARSRLRDGVKLLILGEGSLRPQLERQIIHMQLAGSVLMPGNVANPFPNVKAAEFMVLSSDHEGFPMVLIEALALGKPVISTDCDTGPREIIRSDYNGLLVPVGDVAELATAMDRLAEDVVFYRRLCAQSRDSVKHLAIGSVAKQWLTLS